jgi:hypothetical protein
MSGRDGGHCEYFAAATILLARTAGYPARMAVGFRGGIWNAISGNFTVRNSDAHAWCELLDRAKQEWIRVDPTPPEGNAPFSDVVGAAGGLANLERISDHTFSARFDSLRMFWYRRIVDFNQGSQVALAQRTKQAVEELGHRLKAWLKAKLLALGAWAARPWDLRRIALVAGGAGVLLGLAWVLRAARQVWGRRHDGHPVRRLAGRWLVRLGAWVETPEGAELGGELRRLRYGAAKSWPNPAKIFRASRHFWRRRSS